MRKRRILSLLLAVAVMATMLVAVPLTASAAEPFTLTFAGTNKSYSKSTSVSNPEKDYGNADITVLVNADVTADEKGIKNRYDSSIDSSKKGNDLLTLQAKDGAFVYLKPKKNGTLSITVSAATGKTLGTNSKKLKLYKGDTQETLQEDVSGMGDTPAVKMTENLTSGVEYLIFGSSDANFRLNSITFTPESTDPDMTLSASELSIGKGGTAKISATLAHAPGNNTITWSVANIIGDKIKIDGESTGNEVTISAAESDAGDKATIKATVSGENFSQSLEKTCEVTVVDPKINLPEEITVYPGSTGTIIPDPKDFAADITADNIEWSIEPSVQDVSIVNQTAPYGIVDVAKTVSAPKDITVKATLNNVSETCTVHVKDGSGETANKSPWTASAAVKENQYLIYNDDISINTMFAGNIGSYSPNLSYEENNKTYSNYLNVRYGSVSGRIFKPRDGATVLVVKPKKDLTLYTIYRRQEDGTNSYKSFDGKDIRVFDDQGTRIKAASFTASSKAIPQDGGSETAYRAAESTFKLKADKLYYIGADGTTLNLIEIGYDTNSGFGTMETDSGVYYENDDNGKKDTEKGIIRFLQKYDGAGVTEYGFYFVDQDGVVKKTTHMSGAEGWNDLVGGFYGDLTEIEEEGYNGPFYALPYVCINGGSPIYGPVGPDGGAKVDSEHWVKNPDAAPAE